MGRAASSVNKNGDQVESRKKKEKTGSRFQEKRGASNKNRQGKGNPIQIKQQAWEPWRSKNRHSRKKYQKSQPTDISLDRNEKPLQERGGRKPRGRKRGPRRDYQEN